MDIFDLGVRITVLQVQFVSVVRPERCARNVNRSG